MLPVTAPGRALLGTEGPVDSPRAGPAEVKGHRQNLETLPPSGLPF